MESVELAALGFWMFVAVVVVAMIWRGSREKAEKHETLRRIVEKTGTIDEAKLKALFAEPPSAQCNPKPGGGYRALRIGGTIIMFIGGGVFTFFSLVLGLFIVLGKTSELPELENIAPLFAVGIGIAFAGYGLFFASRYAEPPDNVGNESTEA